jgi:hypothetical protein
VATWEDVIAIASKLPWVEESTWTLIEQGPELDQLAHVIRQVLHNRQIIPGALGLVTAALPAPQFGCTFKTLTGRSACQYVIGAGMARKDQGV